MAMGITSWEQQDKNHCPTGSRTHCHGSTGLSGEPVSGAGCRVAGKDPEWNQRLQKCSWHKSVLWLAEGNVKCLSLWETHSACHFLSYTVYGEQKDRICLYTISWHISKESMSLHRWCSPFFHPCFFPSLFFHNRAYV